ncbi:MAG: hypothetical protein ACUVRD_06025 [Bacteroidia bacterium]
MGKALVGLGLLWAQGGPKPQWLEVSLFHPTFPPYGEACARFFWEAILDSMLELRQVGQLTFWRSGMWWGLTFRGEKRQVQTWGRSLGQRLQKMPTTYVLTGFQPSAMACAYGDTLPCDTQLTFLQAAWAHLIKENLYGIFRGAHLYPSEKKLWNFVRSLDAVPPLVLPEETYEPLPLTQNRLLRYVLPCKPPQIRQALCAYHQLKAYLCHKGLTCQISLSYHPQGIEIWVFTAFPKATDEAIHLYRTNPWVVKFPPYDRLSFPAEIFFPVQPLRRRWERLLLYIYRAPS